MLGVPEAAGDAAAEFDDPVDGFSATVARAIGVEVGQERGLPAALLTCTGLVTRSVWGLEGVEDVALSLIHI